MFKFKKKNKAEVLPCLANQDQCGVVQQIRELQDQLDKMDSLHLGINPYSAKLNVIYAYLFGEGTYSYRDWHDSDGGILTHNLRYGGNREIIKPEIVDITIARLQEYRATLDQYNSWHKDYVKLQEEVAKLKQQIGIK